MSVVILLNMKSVSFFDIIERDFFAVGFSKTHLEQFFHALRGIHSNRCSCVLFTPVCVIDNYFFRKLKSSYRQILSNFSVDANRLIDGRTVSRSIHFFVSLK